MQGASSIDDENREEVDEDETTVASASSFTTRETPIRWKPHDVIKFYRVRCAMFSSAAKQQPSCFCLLWMHANIPVPVTTLAATSY